LKRLMARGRNECAAVALVKHGERRKMLVILRVYALQKAKDTIHITSKLSPIMEFELKSSALTINVRQRRLQLDQAKHLM